MEIIYYGYLRDCKLIKLDRKFFLPFPGRMPPSKELTPAHGICHSGTIGYFRETRENGGLT